MAVSAGGRGVARQVPTTLAAILATVIAVIVSACSDGHIDVRSVAGPGWSSYGGNAANSNFAYPAVPDDLALAWTRPTGGPVTAPITLSNQSNVGVTSNTASGCNVLVLDPNSGRKNFCKRMRTGIEVNALLVDQFDQPYVGEETTFLAFNAGGAIRWRLPVLGVPLSAKFAAPGQVLIATTQGQLLLVDTQTGELAAPEVRLRPDADPADPTFGFGECVTNGPRCAIPSPPAVDNQHERLFVNFWPPGAIASQVRGMDYSTADDGRTIRELWHADIPGGVVGTPTLSADGSTVYAFSRLGRIVALDATSGKTRWTYENGGYGFATMSVSPDGLIIPTGVLGAPLTLLRDAGDHAEQVWQRKDLAVVSLSTLTDQKTAWTVVRDRGRDSLSLTEVSSTDGTTKRSLPLPESGGFATGVSVSPSGQIATATNIGKVYFFDSRAAID
ncbi:PQQ-binding-like beta-propeller repeat protein [Gordonia sp. ABSL11-1]|uniref:outer membrane protein assembly factor BamB family protein n=1 Tax=Gordonia sp. ABSL11-1 TaxID=3053924 RepID=UPI002573B852|nr:PQQ-binding-like beta-propeller repeat protein [Gordonia sp. ABSL11-1]MDL9944073.1 PQQ-binding-like beta-propeller repeat protein [Gordonia sp. ABSL11-1]